MAKSNPNFVPIIELPGSHTLRASLREIYDGLEKKVKRKGDGEVSDIMTAIYMKDWDRRSVREHKQSLTDHSRNIIIEIRREASSNKSSRQLVY